MDEKKLTDEAEELIKAIKGEKGSVFQNCRDCEYGMHNEEAIDLITRQKAEIERLTEANELLNDYCEMKILETKQAVKETAEQALEQFICECIDEHIVGVNDKEYMQMLELKDDILRECYGVEVEYE